MANVETGATVYDYFKGAYQNEPKLSDEAIEKAKEKLIIYASDHYIYNDDKYFMLLNNELHYYTVFHFNDEVKCMNDVYTRFANEVIECAKYCGDVLSIAEDDNCAIEIWIRNTKTGEPHAYYLFPYTTCVIEC